MTDFYDARGNIYAVTTPHALRALGIAIPETAEQAAHAHIGWSHGAIDALCHWPEGQRPANAKVHRCDGLLVGPFQDAAPFDVLIVNTDGTLAERSGNGLTIFAQSLTDGGKVQGSDAFTLRVHHHTSDSPTPLHTEVERAEVNGVSGFWVNIGTPAFGPEAVAAQAPGWQTKTFNGHEVSQVQRLAQINPDWTSSVFVRVGNPHCVTLLEDEDALPGFEQLHEPQLHSALVQVAFAAGEHGAGEPCPAGVNLQWACVVGRDRVMARVFERGEGPTASSGTSASAVASAAWRVGLVDAGLVHVNMPGGTAPVRLIEHKGELQQVLLFGTAETLLERGLPANEFRPGDVR